MTEPRERRDHPRIPIEHAHVELLDADDGRVLGSLANLSRSGLMLNSSSAFTEGATYQVTLRWQDDAGVVQQIPLGIHALWSGEGPGASAWSGFEIIDIDDAGRALLDQLLAAAS